MPCFLLLICGKSCRAQAENPLIFLSEFPRPALTFDFLAITKDGRRCAIAVKPQAKVERSGIASTLRLIQLQIGTQFADRYLLRTDRHITRARVANARLILRSRRIRDEDDVTAVRTIVSKLAGVFMLADIVGASNIGARGFNALIALIDDDFIRPLGDDRIDYITHARLAPAVSGATP